MDLYALVYDIDSETVEVMPLALACDINLVHAGQGYCTPKVIVGYTESETVALDMVDDIEYLLQKAYREHRNPPVYDPFGNELQ